MECVYLYYKDYTLLIKQIKTMLRKKKDDKELLALLHRLEDGLTKFDEPRDCR